MAQALYLCEKPSQAQDLAKVLAARQKGNGYLHNGNGTVVTWAFGHLEEMYMPDDYDDAYKSWNLDTLPITPPVWKSKIKKSCWKQFKVIEGLVAKTDTLYIATDYDREGEAIARSLLDRLKYKGTLKRVCLTALDDDSIRKALREVKEGHETLPLYYSALARQRADWLIGMNISRLYTVLARQTGYRETLHAGRVLSAIISLVCDRDKQIAEFMPSPYWNLSVGVNVQNGQFKAHWVPPSECTDEEGRCINQAYALQVSAEVNQKQAVISKAETKAGTESAPLPFDINSLQQYASKRWGYTSKQIIDAAQALYETHKATSYPRTECRFIPESQLSDAPEILQALIMSDESISGAVAGANTSIKSRAFSDEPFTKQKVESHHGIIPTKATIDISNMSETEFNVYDAIRCHYVAQFYALHEFKRTSIEVTCGNHLFNATGKTPLKQGWKVLFTNEADINPSDLDTDDIEQLEQSGLPQVNHGEPAVIQGIQLDDKMTRPSPHFTESTLLAAMKSVSRYVQEEKFKQILKDVSGLGTAATRADIIQGAVDRGYLRRSKGRIIATEKAVAFNSVLIPAIKSPGMTAAWEMQLEKIAEGELPLKTFTHQISHWITNIVQDIKSNAPALTDQDHSFAQALASAKPPTAECFTCSGELKRIKGKHGFFWGCQNEACRKTFPDNRGKPLDKTKAAEPPKNTPKCDECGAHMLRRKAKAKQDGEKPKSFWGCSSWPSCKSTKPIKSRKKNTAVS